MYLTCALRRLTLVLKRLSPIFLQNLMILALGLSFIYHCFFCTSPLTDRLRHRFVFWGSQVRIPQVTLLSKHLFFYWKTKPVGELLSFHSKLLVWLSYFWKKRLTIQRFSIFWLFVIKTQSLKFYKYKIAWWAFPSVLFFSASNIILQLAFSMKTCSIGNLEAEAYNRSILCKNTYFSQKLVAKILTWRLPFNKLAYVL